MATMADSLYQILSKHTAAWRAAGYQSDFGAIAEILEYQIEPGTAGPRLLRKPQLRALETYWYLRLVVRTPHIFDLYRRLYPKQSELLNALGLTAPEIREFALDNTIDALWTRIRDDDAFVRDLKLESVRETLALDYPSYILALAMGAGKTMLIGAIIATEFAMGLEYPDGPFVQNALVFAPGKTIIESLRELLEVPYDKILPPRLHKPFAASVKLTFTRDGEKDVPVIRGSTFNVVVTNTEKIRIQKEAIRRSDLGKMFGPGREDEARAEVANLRLQAIASLPHLAVFSDEAHHTYGQSMSQDLKRVRQTVDYLHQNSPNLVCVVNTTGTPYYKRQPLKDVVVWYGLSEGIADNILKEVSGNILAYSFDASSADRFVAEIVRDFFAACGDVRLPDGAQAKLAVYFPQTDDLEELRPAVELALAEVGQSPATVLRNTSDSTREEIDAFNRLNDPASPHRVILLVNKGTEGWNCPSLFACALARNLRSSNNFVLQAATRCLRQVPGNQVKARIYLSMDNRAILDRQLRETYGEDIAALDRVGREQAHARLYLRKLNIPPLVVTQVVRTVVPVADAGRQRLALRRPQQQDAQSALIRQVYGLAEQQATHGILQQLGDSVTIAAAPVEVDQYTAAVSLAARYHMDTWAIRDALKGLYGSEDVPLADVDDLERQIEEQTRGYTVTEERVDVALALVKPEGFVREQDAAGSAVYTAEIVYPKDRQYLLLSWETMQAGNPGDFGFHYTPYNFDSNPELSFFEQVLAHLNLHPREVEDIYFTGALTDPDKTDFFVEYKDDHGKWRRYTPDFVVRKKGHDGQPGKCLIVEIKAERERGHPLDGEGGAKALALRRWEDLNPERLQYEMIFAAADTIAADQLKGARRLAEESRDGH